MAGGIFTSQNKVRPGAYVNVKSTGGLENVAAVSGIMTMPLFLNFGPENEITEVTANADLTKFGYSLSDPELLLVKEGLKRAGTILLSRVGSGVKATVTEGPVTVNALYSGSRGNAISVVSKADVNGNLTFVVETYLDGILVDAQKGKTVEDLKANAVVTFSGTGDLTEFSVTLAGGTSTLPTTLDYANYFDKIQLFDFNVMALPVADEAVKIAAASFIKRLRDEEGKKCQLVVANYNPDHESVISVKNGVLLEDGTTITPEQATAWVAGASAGAGVAESLTYTKYDGAIDVFPRYTSTQIMDALKNGEFLFTEKRGEAVVEQDINTLHTYTSEKGRDFAKNRTLRVLDDIANDTKINFEDNFIGKVNNNVDGQELFKANRISYFDSLQAQGAITEFSADDVSVVPGNEQDSIYVEAVVKPVDAMEKLYMLVKVQ